MLEGVDLACARGERVLFRNVSFRVEPGHLLMVSGANGSGKTSLLRMLCGLMAPLAGEIRWQGRATGQLKDEYFEALAYCGHLNGLKDELNAVENLCVAAGLAGAPVTAGQATEVLRRLGLQGREVLPTKWLSQGQRRRAALARLLLIKRPLWVLDEPLTALDRSAVGMVQRLLEEHLAQGGMAVLTTHQELEISSPGFLRVTLGE